MASLNPNLSVTVRLAPLLTPTFTQGLAILQMPIIELSAWLQKQLEENPLVEILQEVSRPISTSVIERSSVVEKRDLSNKKSLMEHLASQARLTFSDSTDLEEAHNLLLHLDERGFLPPTIPTSSVLATLQSFDPPGICARSLQESLMLQLKQKGLGNSLAYTIVQEQFENLLYNRFNKILKNLECAPEDLEESIHIDIASLSLNPASQFYHDETLLLVPDLFLTEEGGVWKVDVNLAYLPRIRLHRNYAKRIQRASSLLTNEDKEAQDYLKKCHKEASQLLHLVKRRSTTLLRLGQHILRTQQAFLEGCTQQPQFLNIREVAQELKLHPSTIARTIAHKYVSCSCLGIVPLKFFFRRTLTPDRADLQNIGASIAAIVAKENREEPLSDEQIGAKLRASGISCARRTVSKYRRKCKIPSVTFRKGKPL